MVIRVCNGFTGTSGTGETIEQIFVFDFDIKKYPYLSDTSITSVEEYRAQPSKKGSHARILPKLAKLKEGLQTTYKNDTDPIRYILFLYYKEELTTHEILEKCQQLGFPMKTQGGFHKFLTGSLGWELRDNKEMTKRRRKKISRKSSPAIQALDRHGKDTISANTEKFRASLISTVGGEKQNGKNFDQEYFEVLETKYEKVFYVLEIFEGISLDILIKISQDSGLGAGVLTRILNDKLKEIHTQNLDTIPLFELNPSRVHGLIRKTSQ